MDRHRAEEIAQSPDMKHVTYNGQQIYIQHVHEQSNSARIFSLEQPEREFDVQLESLMESKRGN
ncbi:H-type small acid-soluble spore protein [Virgibacillus oceani]